MSYLGYFLTEAAAGAAVGFHAACMCLKKLIRDEPEKFTKIFNQPPRNPR
jgi:hypothetical protein